VLVFDLEGLPIPSGSNQYAIAAVLIFGMSLVKLINVLIERYIKPELAASQTPVHPSPPTVEDQEHRDRVRRISAYVQELHEWHKPDGSGRQLWRSPDALEHLREINSTNQRIASEMADQRKQLAALAESIADKLKSRSSDSCSSGSDDRHGNG
jgi:hypothetical protein